MNKILLSLCLVGIAFSTYGGASSPRTKCSTGTAEVTLHVSPPPQSVGTSQFEVAPGFEEVRLLVPRDLTVTGSITGQKQ